MACNRAKSYYGIRFLPNLVFSSTFRDTVQHPGLQFDDSMFVDHDLDFGFIVMMCTTVMPVTHFKHKPGCRIINLEVWIGCHIATKLCKKKHENLYSTSVFICPSCFEPVQSLAWGWMCHEDCRQCMGNGWVTSDWTVGVGGGGGGGWFFFLGKSWPTCCLICCASHSFLPCLMCVAFSCSWTPSLRCTRNSLGRTWCLSFRPMTKQHGQNK